MRYMWAVEVYLMLKSRPPATLPQDLWEWYLARAGRSGNATSWKTYFSAYKKAFGDVLQYLGPLVHSNLHVQYKEMAGGW